MHGRFVRIVPPTAVAYHRFRTPWISICCRHRSPSGPFLSHGNNNIGNNNGTRPSVFAPSVRRFSGPCFLFIGSDGLVKGLTRISTYVHTCVCVCSMDFTVFRRLCVCVCFRTLNGTNDVLPSVANASRPVFRDKRSGSPKAF